MNIAEIINLVRSEILDDTIRPYLWTDVGLVAHLNRAYNELCRESRCLIDSQTPSVCRVNLLANQMLHAISPLVVDIFDVSRLSDGYPLRKTTEHAFHGVHAWRSITGIPAWFMVDSSSGFISVFPKFNTVGYVAGVADIQFVAPSTITKTNAVFTDHYANGDTLVVTGTTLNNGTFTITNVSSTEITVSGALQNEVNTNAVLQKVRDVALLRVSRLPLTTYTANDLELPNPPTLEINPEYHYGLLDGIAKYAYLKQDSETYDPRKAERHGTLFEDFKSRVRFDVENLIAGGMVCSPHYGTT